jgi:hypothetical protein
MLSLKGGTNFLSTAKPHEPPRHEQTGPNQFSVTISARFPPLVRAQLVSGAGWKWAAPLGDAKCKADLSFSQWWEETIFTDAGGRDLSRKNMILTLRSQDGGAHVDDSIRDEAYYWLANDANPGIRSVGPPGSPNATGRPIEHGHRATVRQIGWEMDETLKRLGF